jgi:hypothetical protein
MAYMKAVNKRPDLSEAEIDQIVVSQVDDPTAWDEPIKVQRDGQIPVTISSKLAARILFFARLHREKSIEQWVERVIEERLDLEEAAFSDLKRDMAGLR